MTSSKGSGSRILGRTLAREMTEAELLTVGGGDDETGGNYCWICQTEPTGGGARDLKIYSPD